MNRNIVVLLLLCISFILCSCTSNEDASSTKEDTSSEITVTVKTQKTDESEAIDPISLSGEEINEISEFASSQIQYQLAYNYKNIKAYNCAKLVIENEALWQEKLDWYFPGGCYCWFEDMDFDGEPEFITGGKNAEGMEGVYYFMYCFENNTMISISNKYITNGNKEEAFDRIQSIDQRFEQPTNGFAEWQVEILKDVSGDYSYVFPFISNYVNEGYSLSELITNKDDFDWCIIGGYESNPSFNYLVGNKEVSYDDMVKAVDDWFDGKTLCVSHIGNIPYKMNGFGKEEFDINKEKGSDLRPSGLVDYFSNIIFASYETLTEDEKIEALMTSYNAYSLEETDKTSFLYERFKEDVSSYYREHDNNSRKPEKVKDNNDEWKAAYSDYAAEYVSGDDRLESVSDFFLVDINEDGIPEIYIRASGAFAASKILTYDNDKSEVVVQDVGFCIDLYYIPGENTFVLTGEDHATQYDIVFTLENHTLSIIGRASYTAMSGFDSFNWENSNVTKEEYFNNRSMIFDDSKAKLCQDGKGYTYSEVISAINDY